MGCFAPNISQKFLWLLWGKEIKTPFLSIYFQEEHNIYCKIFWRGWGRKQKILKIEITVLLFSLLKPVLYLFTFFIHLWVCQYIKYLHSYYAIWKSLQHLNFTIRLDVFNEVRLTFERFRMSDRPAGKDQETSDCLLLTACNKIKMLTKLCLISLKQSRKQR